MSKKYKKEEKPVNISISFNIAQNQPLKDINPLSHRGRKIHNLDQHLAKTHRERLLPTSPFVNHSNTMFLKQEQIINRSTFSKADHLLEDFNAGRKNKSKRRSVDAFIESNDKVEQGRGDRPKDSLFISCENQISSKPHFFQNSALNGSSLGHHNSDAQKFKLTPVSRKRMSLKPKSKIINNTPQSTRSEVHGKIQSTVLKCLLAKNKGAVSLDNLKHLISQLVSAQFNRRTPNHSSSVGLHNGKSKLVQRESKHNKSPRTKPNSNTTTTAKITEAKKGGAFSKRELEFKKKDNKATVLKSRSQKSNLSCDGMTIVIKSINESLIKSEASDKDPASNNYTSAGGAVPKLKTSASNTYLKQLVSVKYQQTPSRVASRRNAGHQYEQMAIRIQRCWRQYQTKKLVRAYVEILNQTESLYQLPDPNEDDIQFEQDDVRYREDQQQFKKAQERLTLEVRHLAADRVIPQSSEAAQVIMQPASLIQRIASDVSEDIPDPARLTHFHSHQFGKEEEMALVAEFKKKQIEKWEEALQLIKNNIGDFQGPNKALMAQIFQHLQANKAELQDQVTPIKLRTQRQQYQQPAHILPQPQPTLELENRPATQQQQREMSQLRQSYVSEVNNQQLNTFNFNNLHDALNLRRKSLQQRRERQLTTLENKLEDGKITKQLYESEKQKIQKWIRHQENEIKKTKRDLDRGIVNAKAIIRKNLHDKDTLAKLADSQSTLRKSSSDNFIKSKKPHTQVQEPNSDSDQLSAGKLKKKLDQLNRERQNVHSSQHSSPDISYESLDRQYNQDEDEITTKPVSTDFKDKNQDVASESDQSLPKNNLSIIKPIPVRSPFDYLDQSTKEDIFEFVFLDLCIEIGQQVASEDTMKTARNFIKRRKKPQIKRNKGIKTNITVVKDYLKRLMSYLMRTNLSILDRVAIPMGPSALEMLKYMHYDEDAAEEEEEDLIGTLVLPTTLFQAFESSLLSGIEFEPYYDEPERQHNRVEFLKGVIHVHNKAIFDALNQSLDLQRPFGIWGKPFPWKSTAEFNHILTQEQKEAKFKQSTQKVIQYCTYVCGILIDKEDSLVAPGTRISEDYIEQIKEDRLSRMLANDLIQNEERWVFYDDEQTEVLVEIANLLYEITIKQAVQQIYNIRK